jgi:hypothetical protein
MKGGEKMKKSLTVLLSAVFILALSNYALPCGMMGQGGMGGGMGGGMMGQGMGGQGGGCGGGGGQGGMGGMMGGGMMGQMMGGMMGHDMGWYHHGVFLILQNADKIGLTDDQRKQVEDIRQKYTKENIKLDAELKLATIEMNRLMQLHEAEPSKIKEAIKKVKGVEVEMKSLRIDAFNEAKRLLNEKQKKTLMMLMDMPGMAGGAGMKGQCDDSICPI